MKRLSSMTMAIAIFFMVQASTELKGMKKNKLKLKKEPNIFKLHRLQDDSSKDERFEEEPEKSLRFEEEPEQQLRFAEEPQNVNYTGVEETFVDEEMTKALEKVIWRFLELRPEPVLKPQQKDKPFFRSKPTLQPVLNKGIWGVVEYTESEKQKHALLLAQFKDENN